MNEEAGASRTQSPPDKVIRADAVALQRTFNAVRVKLLHFARRRGVGPDDAEDLVQDCYLKVLDRVGSIEIRSMEAYLRTTYARLVVDHFRRGRPELTGWGAGTEDEAALFEALADNQDHLLDNDALAQDRADCLRRVLLEIESKSPLRGIALELAFNGVSGREMAEALGKTPAAANQFLSQTRRIFETLMRERCEEQVERSKRGDRSTGDE